MQMDASVSEDGSGTAVDAGDIDRKGTRIIMENDVINTKLNLRRAVWNDDTSRIADRERHADDVAPAVRKSTN